MADSEKDKLQIPAKLYKYSPESQINNYFKMLHDKIVELNERVKELENP